MKLTAALPFRSGDVKYIMGEVRVPIGSDGLAVKVDGYHYDARPKDDSIEYLGFQRHVRNDRIGIGLSYPFLLNNTRSLTGTLGYTRPIPKIATKPTTATAGCNRTRARRQCRTQVYPAVREHGHRRDTGRGQGF